MLSTIKGFQNTIKAYQEAMEILSANVQRFQTPGAKKQEYFFQQLTQSMTLFADGIDFSQGAISDGKPLNAAISGDSLFIVKDGDTNNYIYKRASDFTFTHDGYLIDTFGRKVMGYSITQSGHVNKSKLIPIKIDPSTINVGDLGFENQGVLMSNYEARKNAIASGESVLPEGRALFQLALGRFSNPDGLTEASGNAFKPTDRSGNLLEVGVSSDPGFGQVLGGYRESSNIDAAAISIEGVQLQRGYNAVQSALNMVNRLIQDFIKNVAQ